MRSAIPSGCLFSQIITVAIVIYSYHNNIIRTQILPQSTFYINKLEVNSFHTDSRSGAASDFTLRLNRVDLCRSVSPG